MVIVFRSDATEADVNTVIERVTEMGLKPHVSKGETRTIIGCVGDEDRLRDLALVTMAGVESVMPVEKPYKLACREFSAGPTVIPLGTHMTVPGYGEAVAADTGGAIVGATIDLWFPTVAQANEWGRRIVTVVLH